MRGGKPCLQVREAGLGTKGSARTDTGPASPTKLAERPLGQGQVTAPRERGVLAVWAKRNRL